MNYFIIVNLILFPKLNHKETLQIQNLIQFYLIHLNIFNIKLILNRFFFYILNFFRACYPILLILIILILLLILFLIVSILSMTKNFNISCFYFYFFDLFLGMNQLKISINIIFLFHIFLKHTISLSLYSTLKNKHFSSNACAIIFFIKNSNVIYNSVSTLNLIACALF